MHRTKRRVSQATTRARRRRTRRFLTPLAILVISTPALAAPSISFEPAVTTELLGSDPRGAVAGDFDEDGHQDVAVTQWADTDDAVAIEFGDGAGGYHDNQNVGGIPYAQGIGAADFDEDGHLDLVVTEGTQTKLAPDPTCGMSLGSIVAFGDGNGNFTPTVCLVGGSFPIDVAIADYNGDGHQDVAIANNVTHGITTFLGGGDGTFGAGIDLPVAYWTNYTDVVTADFDEDGIPDLAASHYNGAYIFHGNGDGTFAVAGSTGSNVLLEAIDAGDLNGDAHVDVALTEIYDNRLLLCPGNGDGTFGACDTRTVGGFMREVGIADLNRDGLGDAAVSWQSGNQVRVFLGTGGGAFDAGTSFGVGLQPTPMVFVDLNEDGWLDVVEANRNLGDQSYLSTLIQIPQALGCIDGDADGYGDPASPACAFPDLDCDDANAAVNPGAAEDCGNGIDDDCNGLVDAADPACAPVCTDADGDGYALEGGACGLVDCDDANAAVNPGAAEVCGNGIDDNCNGLIDGADPACAAGCAPVRAAGPRTGAAWVYLGTAVLVAGAGIRILYRRRQGK